MKDENEIMLYKSAIYHELGHVLGYILSNKSNITALGPIKSLEIGINKSCVTPINRIYHIDNFSKERKIITENTLNFDRTTAWFIEVILGCTLECCFLRHEFKDCFYETNGSGNVDFNNMVAIRSISSFKLSFDNIDEMQILLKVKIESEGLISKFSAIVDEILKELYLNDKRQLHYEGEKLYTIINKINTKISEDFYLDYLELIANFKIANTILIK